jgi:hypothetical protein
MSGFGNANGGLVIWGVKARKDADDVDAAQAIEPIREPTRYLSNLTSYSGAAVSPAMPGVVHRLIEDTSVAVTLVPETDGGPYMANLGVGKYFTRSGSSFRTMEHFQIVDVLNRRRRPDLRVCASVRDADTIVVGLLNAGRVTAKAPYLELRPAERWWLLSGYGVDGSGRWNLPILTHGGDNFRMPRFGANLTTVVHPETRIEVCVFDWKGLPQDSLPTMELEYAFAAEDVPRTSGTLVIPRVSGAQVNS